MQIDRAKIDASAFKAFKDASGYRSIFDLCAQPRYSIFHISARVFVEGHSSYPCWFTDPAQTSFIAAEHVDACPILFRDLIRLPALFDHKLREFVPPPDLEAKVVVEHCSGCNSFIVKDGNHRVMRLAKFDPAAILTVAEISCSAWPMAEQEMRILHRHREARGERPCVA